MARDIAEETLTQPAADLQAAGSLGAAEQELADSEELESAAPGATEGAAEGGGEIAAPVSAALLALVQSRLGLLVRLAELGPARAGLRRQANLSSEAEEELSRQEAEARRLLTAEQARASLAQIDKRLEAARQRAEEGSGPAPEAALLAAADLGRRQAQLFIQRDETSHTVERTAAADAGDEPLLSLLRRRGVAAEALFGWAVYAAAVRTFKARAARQRQQVLGQLEAAGRSEAAARLKATAEVVAALVLAADRELAWLNERLVPEFWKVYEAAAPLLLESDLAAEEETLLRAFLRYGLPGPTPRFCTAAQVRAMFQECAQPVREYDPACSATHVLYADEYLLLVARGHITPSFDEDLDLNHVGSPRWKRDKAWRRQVGGKDRLRKLAQGLAALEELAAATQGRITALERKAAGLKRDADFHPKRDALRQQAQEARIDLARISRLVDRVRTQCLPEQETFNREAAEKLAAAGGAYPPGELIRQEARQLRRVCRLTARLKETFSAFSLAESYRPDTGQVHARPAVAAELQGIEERDPTVFKEALTAARKPEPWMYMRVPPVVLLAPACGFLALSWNPRGGIECGRLVIPAYGPRPGLLRDLLPKLCADFRWDTSKQSAGVDFLTSDTLAAAYATVRWEYRNRPSEVREKVAIYAKENDRTNFRRHYALLLSSAPEGGKRLFFKCHDIYEAMMKYIALPPGVARLSRQ